MILAFPDDHPSDGAALGIEAGAPTVLVLVLSAHRYEESPFGTAQGFLMLLQAPGTTLAPILTGLAYDWTEEYEIAFERFAVLVGLAALVLPMLRVSDKRL